MICPNCGGKNREGARFCDTCGSPLGSPETGTVRRTVTILFSDIAGSTELGQRLDPELLRGILARYFEAVRTLIERHGGTVEKFIGDAVMAVFGVPEVHEDDAVRAVRAAAEIAEALSDLNDELEEAHGVHIETRTGVDTGEVMVGDASAGDTLVTGAAANLAARLEQAARPGEVLIGAETHRLVRDAVLAEPLEPLHVKGFADPVAAYRVLKIDLGAAGFARRLDAPMVGRERELALLADAFDRAISDGACQLFTVLGIGGVGKSRLLEAFLDRLPDGVVELRGRCLPYGEGITFWPIVEAVGQAACLSGLETPEEALHKIIALIPDDEHAERIGRQIGQILGLEVGDIAPEETLWAIRRFLEGLASERPVAFVIDDLHWAEPTMLDLVDYLADWVVDTPLLLACMARPELLELRPAWGGGKLNATAINLEPLSASECATLVENLLAIDTVDPVVRERVAAAAEGHPLFAEEMIAMLVDDGRIVREGTAWVAKGDLSELSVPPTTSALLAARIERLSHGERATLERASVMGQVFYREALSELAGGDAAEELASLVRKQFARAERSDVPGMEALAFRHLMIRDAAYDGIPKALRADLHERFAGWLEMRAPEQQELIGYHLEQAHRYLLEVGGDADRVTDLAEQASTRLRAAGKRALDRLDVHAASGLLARATELMSPYDPDLPPTLIDLGLASGESGELGAAKETLDEAIRVAARADDALMTARAWLVRLYLAFWTEGPSHEDWVDQVRSDLELFERAGDPHGAAWAEAALGGFSWLRCRAAEAARSWRRATDLFREAGDQHMAAEYLLWLASVPVWGPTPCREALRQIEAYVDEVPGSLFVEAELGATSATLLWMVGEFDAARRANDLGHERRQELGLRVADAHMSQSSGWLELMAGNAAEAEQLLGDGAKELAALGSESPAKLLSAMHSQALYVLGRYDDADAAALAGWSVERWDIQTKSLVLNVRSMVAARRGEFEDGERMARDSVAMEEAGDFINDQADARMALAEVLQLAGRDQDSAKVVREALDRYRAKGNVTQSAMAEARLAELAT